MTLHTSPQLRLLRVCVLSLLSARRQCMHACTHKGRSHVYRWAVHEQQRRRRRKKKGCIYYHHRFYCSETCLVPEILNTHKRALRRYNGGDAPILSKCSLTESSCFFSCAALLHGSPVRINQLFTPGLRWPPPAPARYCGTVKRGTDSDLDALPQHATAEVLIIGSMIIKTDEKTFEVLSQKHT